MKITVALFLTLIFLLPATNVQGKPKDSPPNIVLIVADYMGYADIGPFGAKDIKTPSLDALAAQGVKFTNHYSSAPVCIPARASLLSGLYPQKALKRFENARGVGLHKDHNVLTRTLKSKGYRTAIVGKWHLGSESGFSPNDHGFDYFYGFDSWTLGYHDHKTSDGEPGLYRNTNLIDEQGYLTDLFSDEASQFIKRADDTPYFLYLAYNAGLPPYQAPNLDKSKWHLGWDAAEATRADYVAMIERMDQGIGKVLKTIEALPDSENTLVVFTYDHGGRHLVDSGDLFHGFGTLWEGGIRVPLILRWPQKSASDVVVTAPTIAMDITSTFVEAAAQSSDSTLDGQNLLRIIDSPSEFAERALFWKSRSMKAIRKGQWKYVVDSHSQLLFDMHQDISERKNRFHETPPALKTLISELQSWESNLSPKNKDKTL